MAYIGKEPIVGNFQKCDAISVVNGQAAYTMQVSSTNVTPESSQHCLVSLNGILQAPVTSFTVSGSTLTFASNLATGDVIDFVILLGNVLDLGVPSDDTVGAAQIKNDLISGTTALASEPADTDEFLVSDAGTLKRIDYSLIQPAIVLLATTTCSGTSSVTFDGSFSSTYKNYMVVFSDLVNNGTDINVNVRFRISSSDVTSSDYHWTRNNCAVNSSGSVDQNDGGWNDSKISLNSGVKINGSASEYYKGNGYFYLYNPLGTDNYKFMNGEITQHNADDGYHQNISFSGNLHSAVSALTGLTIYPDAADFTTGTIKLYGIR